MTARLPGTGMGEVFYLLSAFDSRGRLLAAPVEGRPGRIQLLQVVTALSLVRRAGGSDGFLVHSPVACSMGTTQRVHLGKPVLPTDSHFDVHVGISASIPSRYLSEEHSRSEDDYERGRCVAQRLSQIDEDDA